MTRVFSIGVDGIGKDHERLLSSRGYSLSRFKTIGSVVYRPENGPDCLVIDASQRTAHGFLKAMEACREIPKIVVFPDARFTGLSAWKSLGPVAPVSSLSPRELLVCIERSLAEAALRKENEALTRRLASIGREQAFFEEVSKTLTSSMDLHEVLSLIMKQVQKLLKAESWSVLLLNEETNELAFEKTSGRKGTGKKMKTIRLKLGEGIAGWVAREKMPVVVPDVARDPRFNPRVDRETNFRTKSIICVPILSRENVLGVLEIVNKTTGEPFSRDDLDFLLKIVGHAALAIERATLYQKMEELSITDDLTKLFNTRYLNRTVEIEINRANRHRSSLSLIFMDIDHFKTINDNYGHLVGSKVLVEMGQLLLKSLRTVDIVARYGGDEFVIVLPQTTPNHAVQIAERIRRSVEHSVFMKREGLSLKMTASFGVASYPESAKSKEELLRLADEAMYRVKYQTRNGVYAIV